MPSAPLPAARDVLPAGALRPAASYVGGNRVQLLQGGDELFPAMCEAIARSRSRVLLATYIFHDDEAAQRVAEALRQAAARGVQVQLVVDGFGSKASLPRLREWFGVPGVEMQVFRPLERWWAWLQPGQLRRLHQKLCVVDDHCAFVGGINIIDDRLDLHHGRSDTARLDFAVQLQGPVLQAVQHSAHAMWERARLAQGWRDELRELWASARPVQRTLGLLRDLRASVSPLQPAQQAQQPVQVAFLVRDNLRQRRTIERSYIEAIRRSQGRIDIACAYFYPGRAFRRALRGAAQRGVQVRLLLQGKLDYRFAGLAASVLYDELLAHGVRIFEYTPAFLHAKVAVVDGDWATVGSSNIDPLSLLLNLEANAVVRDEAFTQDLAQRLEQAMGQSREVQRGRVHAGWPPWLQRGFVAWCAGLYLRLAGISARY